MSNNKFALYIHIPFCKSKCYYCDFYSLAALSKKDSYIKALCNEFKLRTEEFKNSKEKPAVKTIYFGGGTPSLLTEKDLSTIFESIEKYFDTSTCKEITLEANPDDLSLDYLEMIKQFPFNRMSIGIQSFKDDELKAINRRHTAQEAFRAVEKTYASGFTNISIDLMYGIPLQNFESFDYSISKALSLPISHISSYALSWEEGSVLYHKLQKGELKQADDEFMEKCYFHLLNKLKKAGFNHYEFSNFCKPGMKSKHNSSYWDGTHYLGFGPGAHSFPNEKNRIENIRELSSYILNLSQNKLPKREIEIIDTKTAYNDYLITRLRTKEGVNLEEIKSFFGPQYYNYCLENSKQYLKTKKLIINNSHLIITHNSLFISDMIISDLFFV